MQIEINYTTEKQYITVDPNNLGSQNQEDLDFDDQVQSSFLHKETYVKRKIPLNGIISVNIESIQNIKESIENIEHFAKIQQSALSQTQDNNQKSSKLTNVSGTSKRSIINQSKEMIDRRRILTQIFRQGLNIAVIGSIFGDDSDLQKKFPQSKHTTKLLYNTLNPIFDDFFNLNVQMDTKLFEYLNNKKAKFEIRHYIIPAKEEVSAGILSKMHVQKEQPSNRSMLSEDQEDANIFESSDYIVIGYVTVPLRNLLASNNGIDDSFVIFDDYKQQMGSLKLRISLNHHSQQRPLYSQETSTKNNNLIQRNTDFTGLRTTMIDRSVKYNQTFARTSSGFNGQAFDNQMILGINFIELIFKNRENLFNQALVSQQLADQQSYMYLKFKVNGQNYQTKFLSNQTQKQSQYLKQLKLRVFDIKKTVLFQLDLLNQQEMEDMFGKPLEIQLWFKKEAVQRHQQPDQEELIGSFFIELNDLGKIKNKRIKDQGEQTQYQAYEGYFSLYDYQKEQVQCDRLGCKVFLMRKEYETQLADAEVLFHNLNGIEQQIQSVLDPNQKGFVDYEDLVALISKDLQDPYLSMLKQLVDQLQYKNSEKVFYSPLFGQLPPYFRLMKKFDSFGVIDKFNKEFNQLDNQSTGYLPLPIFRSLLEHELKIKEKIVVDFIQGLREVDAQQNLQSLDVNLFSHSLKNQIDYVVLLRKIAQYFDMKNQEKHTSNESQFLETQLELEGEVTLKIDIESAMRLKNPLSELEPPNSQVVLKLPFLHSKSNQIQTQVVQKSSYPAWHLVGQQIKFQLSQENLKAIIESPLEFEVYHHYLANRDQSSKHLIGVAYLDLSLMVFVDGIFQMSGYFHVLNKDKYKDGHAIPLTNTVELQNNSLGQLKLNIQTTSNLKQMAYSNNIQRTLVKENSPIKDKRGGETINDAGYQSYYPNQMTMSFNRDTSLNVFQQQPTAVLSETHQKLQYSFNRFNLDLNEQQEEDLKIKHTQNMSELDKLLSTLKSGKLEDEVPDSKFEKIVRNNLQTRVDQQSSKNSQPPVYDYGVENNLKVTHGYNQSQHLIQQLNKFTQSVRDNDRIQQLQRDAVKAAVQEQEYEGSEFDRDEELKNDFDHHQPSYNVFEQHNNLRSQQLESNQDQEEDQLEEEIIQHNQAQNQVLYFEQDPLKQSFSPLNFPIGQSLHQYQQVQQTLPHQTNQPIVPPLNITNVFERMNLNAHIESDSEDRQNYGMNNGEDNQNNQIVEERLSASFNQQIMNQQNIKEEPVRDSAPATEIKKKSIYQIMDEDDDEMDPIEMARLQKILGSKQK